MAATGSIAHDYVVDKFKAPVSADERIITVSTDRRLILNNNPRRLAWSICNWAGNSLSVGFRPNISFGEGLLIPGGGGTVTLTVDEDGEAVTYAVYGVLGAGAGNIWVYEVVAR